MIRYSSFQEAVDYKKHLDKIKVAHPEDYKQYLKTVKEHGQELANKYLKKIIEGGMKRYQELKEGVAETILKQLGGNKFIAMTGAKQFTKGKNSDGEEQITFKLPRAKDGINVVIIALTSMDLYRITFGKLRGVDYKVVKEIDGVYNDQLQEIFTRYTGLDTHL